MYRGKAHPLQLPAYVILKEVLHPGDPDIKPYIELEYSDMEGITKGALLKDGADLNIINDLYELNTSIS